MRSPWALKTVQLAVVQSTGYVRRCADIGASTDGQLDYGRLFI
jgi:hypothetical protein